MHLLTFVPRPPCDCFYKKSHSSEMLRSNYFKLLEIKSTLFDICANPFHMVNYCESNAKHCIHHRRLVYIKSDDGYMHLGYSNNSCDWRVHARGTLGTSKSPLPACVCGAWSLIGYTRPALSGCLNMYISLYYNQNTSRTFAYIAIKTHLTHR
jgi:hypothetical protein